MESLLFSVLCTRTWERSRVRKSLIRTPLLSLSASRQRGGRYSARSPRTATDGYQTQATSSSFVSGAAGNSSVRCWSTQKKVVRPTEYGPEGVGSSSGVRCSSHAKASNPHTLKTASSTTPAKLYNSPRMTVRACTNPFLWKLRDYRKELCRAKLRCRAIRQKKNG